MKSHCIQTNSQQDLLPLSCHIEEVIKIAIFLLQEGFIYSRGTSSVGISSKIPACELTHGEQPS